jgi:hypothetical protein
VEHLFATPIGQIKVEKAVILAGPEKLRQFQIVPAPQSSEVHGFKSGSTNLTRAATTKRYLT